MTAPVTSSERVWFAHAIRGPACLLVVLTHLGDLFVFDHATAAFIGHFPPVEGLPSPPWGGVQRFLTSHGVMVGAVGVLLFFLVSGFVIPLALERRSLSGFVVRRFFRLYPTLWVCLGITVTVLLVQGAVLLRPFPYGTEMVAGNALLVAPYTRAPWIEPVLWSLAVEELFYLVACLLGWRGLLARRSAVVLVAAGLTGVALATRGAAIGSPLFWLGFNAAFVIFILLGVVLHHVFRGRWSLAGAGAVFVVVCGSYFVSLRHGPTSAVSGLYTNSSVLAMVIFGALFLARDRLPYSRLVDALSNISYPLYLLHAVIGYVVIRAVFVATGSYYLGLATALAVSVALATAVHFLVEMPTNNFGRRLSRRRRPERAAPVEAPLEAPQVAVAGDVRP